MRSPRSSRQPLHSTACRPPPLPRQLKAKQQGRLLALAALVQVALVPVAPAEQVLGPVLQEQARQGPVQLQGLQRRQG